MHQMYGFPDPVEGVFLRMLVEVGVEMCKFSVVEREANQEADA